MKRILTVNGAIIDAGRRSAVNRDDIETHTALFQRDVETLIARNVEGFKAICEARGVVGESVAELQEGLVQLFASETHYRRRNKLRNQVTTS